MRKNILILLLVILTFQVSWAQNPFVTNYSVAEGLPTSKVYCVTRDQKGFLWFGTDAGVIRYDGSNFKLYTEKDGLSYNLVARIGEDKRGRLWFLNFDGSVDYFQDNHVVNGREQAFLRMIKTDFMYHNFFEAPDSTLYFYNGNADVAVVRDTEYLDFSNLNQLAGSVKPLYINQTTDGNLQAWAPTGIFEFVNINTFVKQHDIQETLARVFPKNERETFTIDNEGYLSIYRDSKPFKRRILMVGSSKINSVLEDEDGLIWVSAFDKGVFCYRGSELLFHLEIESPQNLTLDNENNIWAVSNSEGIFKVSRDILRYSFWGKEKFGNEGINHITSSFAGGIWATNGDKIFYINGEKIYQSEALFNGEVINYMHSLQGKKLLAHGIDTRLYTLSFPDLDEAEQRIRFRDIGVSIFDVKRSVLDSTGQYLYSFGNDDIISVRTATGRGRFSDLNMGRIRNVFVNSRNQLFVNAAVNPIVDAVREKKINSSFYERFNGKFIDSHLVIGKDLEIFNLIGNEMLLQSGNKFYDVLKEQRSQVDFRIRDMVYYRNTLFFFTVNTVYFIVDPQQVVNGHTPELSRLNIEFHNIKDVFCQDNKLYVGSDDGMTVIPVEECVNAEVRLTRPYFSKVLLDEEEADISKGMLLYKNKKRLSIEFSSLNFSSIPSNYSYMLEGVDKDWINGNGTQVVYLNLHPGHYTFKLKSRKNMEPFSEIIELPVFVEPTLWQRPVTKATLVLLLLVFGLFIIRAYYQRRIEASEKNFQLVTLENRALQSMMNPHFIFNSLGSIQKYLLENQPEEAGNYLSQFARLIRQTMNSIKSNAVRLDDEVDRLRNYIELERLRMDRGFDYTIELDEQLSSDDYNIPSMIIQPFVENAIWHGISQLPGQGIIAVDFYYINEKSLGVNIIDNGIGYTKARAYGKVKDSLNMASTLTRKRIQLLGEKHGVDTRIVVTDANPGAENPGTKVTLVLPILD